MNKHGYVCCTLNVPVVARLAVRNSLVIRSTLLARTLLRDGVGRDLPHC